MPWESETSGSVKVANYIPSVSFILQEPITAQALPVPPLQAAAAPSGLCSQQRCRAAAGTEGGGSTTAGAFWCRAAERGEERAKG